MVYDWTVEQERVILVVHADITFKIIVFCSFLGNLIRDYDAAMIRGTKIAKKVN